MKNYKQLIVYLAALTGAYLFAQVESSSTVSAQVPETNIPDFTNDGEIPEGANHDWNLGPTGARGWIYSNKLETSEARQILVTQVDTGSPADGILLPGDVILGIAQLPFSYDPRTELGKAITLVEATDGNLSLICWRDGSTNDLELQLPVLGGYSSTAPFDCPKSERIFEQGCAALAEKMRSNQTDGHAIVRSLNALALLSSGREEYLPLVREQVELLAKFSDLERRSLHAWSYGPINILLAEYTLATGDQTYLPDLKRITMEIVNGQSEVGSWGHRFIQPNGRLGGYGMMNAPGLPLTVSLILARKAGVEDPALDNAIEKSTGLIRFYVGKGSVPYGDHAPWIQTHDDNGKNGIAAVMFNLLEDEEAAGYFSRMSVASYGAERDAGHTGNFFNILWAMPGVALSGPEASGAWMQEFGWYYDLARRWDGTYRHQGPPQTRPDSYRNWDSTGACLLAYAQPLRNIYLTGKRQNIVEQVDAPTATGLVADGRDWSPRRKQEAYANRTAAEIMTGLGSWSPVVRERSATELARREDGHMVQLIAMLDNNDTYIRLGACQALIMLKGRAAPAVGALRKVLSSDDLWLRIKAAEALAGIGKDAMPAVPQLLTMLSEKSATDPRGMQQRYLCFALFNRRTGMLGQSLEGVDREALFDAVRAGLENEDGRARGSLSSVYKNLTYEEIEPLLPAIYQAVTEPAASGIMFADEIRLSGLEILAQHRIEDGMQLGFDLIELERWGQGKRLPRCLKVLQQYGYAANELLPELRELEKQLADRRQSEATRKQIDLVQQTIVKIESSKSRPELRSLPVER